MLLNIELTTLFYSEIAAGMVSATMKRGSS